MPSVVLFREEDGRVPLLEWFGALPDQAREQCIARVELLAAHGHRLRRPHADFLRDGIYELRAKHHRVNYRMLYFFHGGQAIVVSHGISKQRASIPDIEIERAKRRKAAFTANPRRHTHQES